MTDELRDALASMRSAYGHDAVVHPARGLVFVTVPGEPNRTYHEGDVLSHWRRLQASGGALTLGAAWLKTFWDTLGQFAYGPN